MPYILNPLGQTNNANTPKGNSAGGMFDPTPYLKPPGGSIDPVAPPSIADPVLDPNIQDNSGEDIPDTPDPADEYEKNITVPRLIKQRDQEYMTLKQAYVGTIKGDSWETAIGLDTIAQKNLQNFKDRWDKIMEEKEFTSYDYSSDYGGYSSLYDSGFKSLTNMGNTGSKSGYLGG